MTQISVKQNQPFLTTTAKTFSIETEFFLLAKLNTSFELSTGYIHSGTYKDQSVMETLCRSNLIFVIKRAVLS